MKKCITSLLLITISIGGFTKNNNITINNMINDIEIVVLNKSEKNWVGGIFPVSLIIKNNTGQAISLPLLYPNPAELSFDTPSPLEKKLQEDIIIDARIVPTTISPGETYEIVYFLNRYFNFVNEGKFEISYSLKTTIDMEGSKSTKGVYEGTFFIELKNPSSNEELEKQYAYYSNQLKSGDNKRRKEAVEALSFIDNPLCIDYIIPMLSIEDLEITGIEILSRFNTAKIQELISGMLSHEDFFVVSAAITALGTMNVQIPRIKFINMLSSGDPTIIWTGLENLSLNPDVNDKEPIILLLEELQKDSFLLDFYSSVIEKAKEYYSLLTDKESIKKTYENNRNNN